MPAKKQYDWSFLIANWRIVLPTALIGLIVLQLMGLNLKLVFFLGLAAIVLFLLRRRILRVFPKGKKRIGIQLGSMKFSVTKKQVYMGALALVGAWIVLSLIGKIFWALAVLALGFAVIGGGLALGERMLSGREN
ncbi:hypothetical protein [Hirschia maritima]|uniref:hypothetical protein n=1 Tax=Hirschia maritima TaxID=1121961 RepID=UPI000370E060|nr:hypothetical protein [Hirschia maritima]